LDRAGNATPTCPDCGEAHPPGVRCSQATLQVATEPPNETLLFGGDSLGRPPTPPPVSKPATDPLVGTQVGSFRVVRLLGRGGMGTVYLAEHPAIGSKVAVKFLHESLAENPQVVARFYDEARAVNLIGHENIVAIYDLNLLPPNRYYFVMEYLDGETLHAAVRAKHLDASAALDVLLQLCDALQCAHERGVVHRDLKPDNVFLVTRGGKHHFVKLVDFGIAKLRGGAITSSGRTSAGLIVGTPEYMAPEQCDDGAIDARTDVYALGVMAYELLAGRLPFQGKTVTQLLLAHLQQQPPALSQFAKGIDPELERTIMKALAKAPADRHADMAHFAEALRPVRARLAPGGEPSPAAPAAVLAPAPQATATAATPAPASAPAPAGPPADPVAVELRSGDTTRRLLAVEVTRGGIFLGAETELPPLFSRVALTLSHPSLRTKLELNGEVVRHVSAAEAGRWHMVPGFAVQLVELTPERRAAITDLVEATRGAPPPAQAPAAPRTSEAQLRELEERPATTHYSFLGLPPDAEFAEIRKSARAVRARLEAIRARPEALDQHARATALLARLDVAQHTLSVPAERLVYDSGRGNYLGVARCMAAGVPQAVMVGRRREYLARHADRERAAQGHLARAQVARKMQNRAAAIAAYEAALAADPLDLATLEAYVAYRRQAS
jgi:eukaryotic-like serine/threonine-protein kinase